MGFFKNLFSGDSKGYSSNEFSLANMLIAIGVFALMITLTVLTGLDLIVSLFNNITDASVFFFDIMGEPFSLTAMSIDWFDTSLDNILLDLSLIIPKILFVVFALIIDLIWGCLYLVFALVYMIILIAFDFVWVFALPIAILIFFVIWCVRSYNNLSTINFISNLSLTVLSLACTVYYFIDLFSHL